MNVNIQKSGVVNYTADLGVFEAITSTTTGEIATFESNVLDAPCPSVLCTINPVQDLHGQDYPYPSGGGKNKVNATTKAEATVNGIKGKVLSDNEFVMSGTSTGNGDLVTSVTAFTMFANTPYTISFTGKDNRGGAVYMYFGGQYATFSTTQHSRTYTPTADLTVTDIRFRSFNGTTVDCDFKLQIEEGSTATPYAPYSNICPITGHTELNLVHTGANLWDEEWEVGNIDTSGIDQPTDNSIRSKNYIPCIPNTNYYKYIGGSKNGQIFFYEKDKTFISRTGNAPSGVVTSPSNAYFMRFASYSDYGTTYLNNISINYPSTDTSYHAYTGTTTTTDLGTTVYGGTLDVVSGTLTIDKAIISDIASKYRDMFRGTYSVQYRIDLSPVSTDIPYTQRHGAISNMCGNENTAYFGSSNHVEESQTAQHMFAITSNGAIASIYDPDTTLTKETFEQKYANAVIVYPLATPFTIQLTPQEVKSLLGGNNFYHDCKGQVAVTHFTIRSYSLDGFFENNTDRLSISKTFINSIDFIEI